jgi:hypothetical protein
MKDTINGSLQSSSDYKPYRVEIGEAAAHSRMKAGHRYHLDIQAGEMLFENSGGPTYVYKLKIEDGVTNG